MENILQRGFRLLRSLPKTIYFNFYYFPFKTALRLPVFIDHHVRLMKMGGKVALNYTPKRFDIKLAPSLMKAEGYYLNYK
ncbi:hypothetical protein ACDQ55_20230 [Chitinophaga sp. 30R24]|uniref:hypothetical protein n=1 Tax=Chitinophaga sp. 30R24 TaxID=3248838 RepID=UPI003B8F849E